MAGPTFREVVSGQGLRIPAADYNAAMRAARRTQLNATGDGIGQAPEHFQHAQVYNAGETAVDRHRVLAVHRPAILPHEYTEGMDTIAANPDGFASRLRLHGETPVAGDLELVITTEAIPAGFMGRCCFSGVAICLVEIDDEDHTAASAQASTVPISSSRGPLQIIWKQAEADRETEGFALCLVRIRGSRPAGELFAVLVTVDGGDPGGDDGMGGLEDCTLTYTVKDLYGVELGTTMTPQKRRFPDTEYLEGDADTPGLAYYDENGDLQLFDANELPGSEECP